MEAIRVILTDDHPFILSSLQHLVDREEGIEVIATCKSGQDTIEAVEKHLPDVLVLPTRLQDLDALEVMQKLSDAQRITRFLILSGQIKKETIEELLSAGASGYIAKDEAIEWLAPAIRGVMQGAIYLSPMIKNQLMGQNDDYKPSPYIAA